MFEPTLLFADEGGRGTYGIFADIAEGLSYLRQQPRILALGFTYACMMAGVISANILVVALAKDLLSAGARGYGYIEMGWAVGAIVGGLLAGVLARKNPYTVLILALATLAVGHALFPFVRLLAVAIALNALFGVCRALGGVLTQSSIMISVPRHFMARTQSAFSVLSTILQVGMSFTLGWFAEHATLSIAFLILGGIYGGGALAALRVRALSLAPGKTAAPA